MCLLAQYYDIDESAFLFYHNFSLISGECAQNVTTKNGISQLMLAAVSGQVDAARCLLSKGADIYS